MGSSSASISQSTNTNAPFQQDSAQNPINIAGLSNSNASVGNKDSVNGSINSGNKTTRIGGDLSILDGGAIQSAFGFGSEAIKVLADITKSNSASINQNNAAALGFADKNNAYLDKYANKDANSDWTQNKTLLYVLGAVAVFYVWKGLK